MVKTSLESALYICMDVVQHHHGVSDTIQMRLLKLVL